LVDFHRSDGFALEIVGLIEEDEFAAEESEVLQ
jgi:hypothetical protein